MIIFIIIIRRNVLTLEVLKERSRERSAGFGRRRAAVHHLGRFKQVRLAISLGDSNAYGQFRTP